MSTVPSTPTATDKWEEIRKLNLEIAALTDTRDRARRAAETTQLAVEEARQKASGLEGKIHGLETEKASAVREIKEFVSYCRTTIQAALSAMEEVEQYAKAMRGKVDGLGEEIERQEKNLADLLEAIAKENAVMSDKRLDLEIYHRRIIEAADKHLPGQKVVI